MERFYIYCATENFRQSWAFSAVNNSGSTVDAQRSQDPPHTQKQTPSSKSHATALRKNGVSLLQKRSGT